MEKENSYNKVSVLIVGAGPAGLSAAMTLKKAKPQLDVVVIDKAQAPGNHNLSGAVLEPAAIARLLDPIDSQWAQTDAARDVLLSRVNKDDVMFLLGKNMAFGIECAIRMAKTLKLGFGQMSHHNDFICSVSKLTAWLCSIAQKLGVEVLHGFAAQDILWDSTSHIATGVKLVDQGLDKEGRKLRNYLPGEIIHAKHILLAEGCDGLLSETFIKKAGLKRQGNQLYSIGVKELIKVSDAQYQKFGPGRVVHAMGYPLWTPLIGPAMFGGGIMYPMGGSHIAVGMIVGLDYKYCDFNPQDALTLFKEHKFVKQFIEGVKQKAMGEEVLTALSPAQQVIKIVHEELIRVLGSHQSRLRFSNNPPSVIMIVGLQGSGKTGVLNIIDLANVHSCAFIATEDVGRLYPNGQFEILGRMDQSDIRGCSLLAV